MNANREGFHLMEVAAAPLLVKRRGMKRKSFDSHEPSPGFESTTNRKSVVIGPLETVPEVASPQLSRPSLLLLQLSAVDYEGSKCPIPQNTQDNVISWSEIVINWEFSKMCNWSTNTSKCSKKWYD